MKPSQALVQKFGGSSVADPEKIRQVARIVANAYEAQPSECRQLAVVVSAMGDTTDDLVQLARQICETPAGREYDVLLTTGEMVSAALLAMALETLGYPAISLNGQQAGILTEDLYNRARILAVRPQAIEHYWSQQKIVVITGFQGVNSQGNFTTLGRGGSDTSAVALAAALNAQRCDIYTDVRGVFSTDPRRVPEARKIDQIAYTEMLELARVGAKVLHPRSVETAYQGNVSVCVRSTFHLDDPGTLIVGLDGIRWQQREQSKGLVGIACDENVVYCSLSASQQVLSQLLGAFATQNIAIDMLSLLSVFHQPSSQSSSAITFTVSTDDIADVEALLSSYGPYTLEANWAKISLVGAGIPDKTALAEQVKTILNEAGIPIKRMTAGSLKLGFLVQKTAGQTALQALHQAFFGLDSVCEII